MIRKAELKDLEAIAGLLDQVHALHAEGRPDLFIAGTRKFSDDELKEILAGDEINFHVYTENDEVLAYVCYLIREKKDSRSRKGRREFYIEDICVDEKQRHKGIASKLFEYAEELAKKEGCDVLTLNVWELNRTARTFYEGRGMKPLKTIMEKKI
ncbi:MAG: GNAT family N-acetyltransferase [Erysipelotrichaceae bacterium]|nr:GNAT family N-acetyltransferase [Erysipelotrichaceae bacterium]